MHKYYDSIFTPAGRQWDVYAIENDPVYENDCIAITGPADYLKAVYETVKAGNELHVKTDYSRGIDFIQYGTVDAVLECIDAAA